ncbi:unnamed protein product [Ranitomeya imitator]|uniref:C-type lectin domain-containing protein n=1 Tax=Ranitomeya imitator TaxID=111125 RepID=A0ABN9MDH6_9NEOB|nr:unnamed protein product [Ranitomeya imitator]
MQFKIGNSSKQAAQLCSVEENSKEWQTPIVGPNPTILKLEGRIQVVGGKMMATSGKEADFATSKSKCKSVGGQIVTPKSEAENNAVLTFVKKYNRNTYLGMPGVFTYQNGNPAVYTRWRKGEPSGKGKQNCTEMYIDGQWNYKACNQKRLTVCEL